MSDLFTYPEGATPIDPDDAEGLIPTWVSNRGELNDVEQENIAEATLWASRRSWSVDEFRQQWLKGLHKRMFDKVWKWAGQYRQSDTNIGEAWQQIPISTETLLLDLREQMTDVDQLPWPAAELAVRFHHRLVSIHPFPNGNGRHARLAADIVLMALDQPPFGWGAGSQIAELRPVRTEYLDALRTADAGDYALLISFATR